MNTYHIKYGLFCLLILITVIECTRTGKKKLKLFTHLPADSTGIHFVNRVHDQPDFNIINYLYFYDGGGVAIGDINNDGLDDIYFSSNLQSNHLYINEGSFRFRDITQSAGVGGGDYGWTTGVNMADINGDGWLDVYVCRVDYRDKKGRNQLFINNGDNTFREKAAAYGLDHQGFGTQAAFLDYDKDGDLDMYLLNHSVHTKRSYGKSVRRIIKDPRAGDELYRNDGDHFTDVTKETGIYSSALGYGLGIAVHDINQDGWPDIYIGNDFHEDDYLYINNGDGTFSERLQDLVGHTSKASMGNDIADFNNDGLPDIFSLDMRPEDQATYQRSGGPDSYQVDKIKKEFGYDPQLPRNTLQLNRGKLENGAPLFSDIGAFAGVDATDWSWAGLFCDLNLDGRKDLYVTNGIYRRSNNLDYILRISQEKAQNILTKGSFDEVLSIIDQIPSVKVANYMYENEGDLSFQNKTKQWGLATPGFSNGAAYGDLDNDGDLDLVVNNVNMPAFIYRNNADSLTNYHYLKVELKGDGKNTRGIGAKVILKNKGKTWYREQAPVRGFQSSVSPTLNFGLGNIKQIDSLTVIWPDDRKQRIKNVNVDQKLTLKQSEVKRTYSYTEKMNSNPIFENITDQANIDYKHQEDTFNEFKRQPLMPHMLSTEGPALAVSDVNGDGWDDFYVGGSRNQAGQLYLQTKKGQFKKIDDSVFYQDKISEDIDAVFFDADSDGDLDLYVVSGGDEFPRQDPRYSDRLYINDRHGGFTKSVNKLPQFYGNGSCVAPADFDGDGDVDLFVGSRSVPLNYGKTPRSYLLENKGSGRFKEVTDQKALGLSQIGMVTDAKWADIDGDHKSDLILAGEYMPMTIFHNTGDRFINYTKQAALHNTNGWWNSVLAEDFDDDGDIDLVAGNLGTNTVIKASPNQPLKLYLSDFDGNGLEDPLISTMKDGKPYPLARLDELMKQMPDIKRKFSSYGDFSNRLINDIFSAEKLKDADVKQSKMFKSSYFENEGASKFAVHPLPPQAQFSLVRTIAAEDFNYDGYKDILLSGNFYTVKPSEGRYDAGYGCLLLGTGDGRFKAAALDKSGFIIHGEGRDLKLITLSSNQKAVLLARNDDKLQLFWIAFNP